MARRVLTDEIWFQLLAVMESKGCYDSKNAREVMEAIIWKLRVGGPWRDIPKEFCPWQTAFDRFNRWAKKGLWTNFFSAYEAKLIRSGYSPMEVTSALISMRAELEKGSSEPLDDRAEEIQQRFILPPMRMEIRSILKSLGVKLMTLKQPPKLFVKSARPKTSSPTKATTRKSSAKKRAARE